MRQSVARHRRAAGGLLFLGLLTGCAHPSQEATTSWAPVFAAAVEAAIAAGVDPTQIEILTRVADAGVVTVQDVREALESTYQCLDDAGISHTEEMKTTAWGFDVVSYSMTVPPGTDVEAAVAVSDECTEKHSGFVERLYVNQPSYVEGADRYRNETILPGVRACMDAAGAPYDPEAGFDDTWDAALAWQGEEWKALGGPGPFTACFAAVGDGSF